MSNSSNGIGYLPVFQSMMVAAFTREELPAESATPGRLMCAGSAVATVIVSPFLYGCFAYTAVASYADSTSYLNAEWHRSGTSKFWAVLDVTASILISSPILLLALVVRFVAGIVYPGFAFKKQPEESEPDTPEKVVFGSGPSPSGVRPPKSTLKPSKAAGGYCDTPSNKQRTKKLPQLDPNSTMPIESILPKVKQDGKLPSIKETAEPPTPKALHQDVVAELNLLFEYQRLSKARTVGN